MRRPGTRANRGITRREAESGVHVTTHKKTLIVGADGMIGGYLCANREWTSRDILATTRRIDTLNARRVYLDLFRQEEFNLPGDVDAAVVLAGGGNYEYCATHPEEAARVSLECVPALIERFLGAGIFVVFVSSASVFGDMRLFPDEDARRTPGGMYGELKARAEDAVMALAERMNAGSLLALPRLSKVVNMEKTRPFPDWLAAWKCGRVVTPFLDLNLCPASPDYVAAFLSAIIRTRTTGILHCSGDTNLNYAEFCLLLANRLGVSKDLIRPVLSAEVGVTLGSRGKTPGLGMRRTIEALGIHPQRIAEALHGFARYEYI